jgi:outer membrane protein
MTANALLTLLLPLALGAQQLPETNPSSAPATLALGDAVALAKRHNPAFMGQRNDISVAEWQIRSAYADFIPALNVSNTFGYIAPGERRSGSVVLGEQPSIYSSSYAVGLSYSVNAQRLSAPSIANADLAVARERVAGAATTLVNDVTRSYLTALQSQQTVKQTEGEVARTRDYVELARARTAAGAASSIDLKRAEVQQAQAELKRMRAENQATMDLLSLGRVMGVLLPADTKLTSDFELVEPAWDADSLIALALRRGPSLGLSRASEHAAKARLRSAQGGYFPSLSFNVSYNGWVQHVGSIEAGIKQRLGNTPDSASASRVRAELLQQMQGFPFNYNKQPISASMTVSIPVFQGLARTAQIQSSRAALEDASHQRTAEELRVRFEVTSAVLNLRGTYRAAALQRVIKQKAAEELRLAEDRLRYGATGPLAVADAQTQLAQAELDEIQAIYDFHKQLAALETLIGVSLRQPNPNAESR